MTDANKLQPLPTLRPGDSHMESLIEAAIQGHASTREAMRWLVRQIVPPQALAQVHPAQAEVTDADIVAVMRDGNNCNYNDEAEHIQFARAILALRPVQVPMTKLPAGDITFFNGRGDAVEGYSAERVWEILHEHGITAQAKKETP